MKAPEAIRQNVFYSVLDYVSQPAMMLIAAPLLLRELGAQQYGTWMLVNSIAATASGLGGGFGDGATRYVSMYRGCGDRSWCGAHTIGGAGSQLRLRCTLGHGDDRQRPVVDWPRVQGRSQPSNMPPSSRCASALCCSSSGSRKLCSHRPCAAANVIARW